MDAARLSALALCLLAGNTASAGDDIFGYTDAAGVVHLSNVPAEESYRLVLPGRRDDGRPQAEPARNRIFAGEIEAAARDYDLDPALLHAVIAVESNYNAAARSPKGAVGLMQLMPATSRR
ncbi:MAG TPA: transglycosylase SLT domain-containing protein, partial [Rhodocyclaceae bacterium]|nr:transglycosylase SLT domain-containing protein [Rhodocyclaceae bacterium]